MPEKVLLVLAAGNSSRLGHPKQMLPMSEGETLLQHTLRAGGDSQIDQIVVVLGSKAEAFEKQIVQLNLAKKLQIVYNPHWSMGMGSSIKVGLKFIEKQVSNLAGILVSVCDQPHLRPEILDRLIKEGMDRTSVVASLYSPDQFGTPVWFPEAWIDTLMQVPDEKGALFLLKKRKNELFMLPFPKGEIDIDTEGDWMRYLASRNNS